MDVKEIAPELSGIVTSERQAEIVGLLNDGFPLAIIYLASQLLLTSTLLSLNGRSAVSSDIAEHTSAGLEATCYIRSPSAKASPVLAKSIDVIGHSEYRKIRTPISQPSDFVLGELSGGQFAVLANKYRRGIVIGRKDKNVVKRGRSWLDIKRWLRVTINKFNARNDMYSQGQALPDVYVSEGHRCVGISCDLLGKGVIDLDPCALVNFKVKPQISPLNISDYRIADSSDYSQYTKDSFPWLPLFPPWIGFTICALGAYGLFWGWENEKWLPWSAIVVLCSVSSIACGLLIVIPWSVS